MGSLEGDKTEILNALVIKSLKCNRYYLILVYSEKLNISIFCIFANQLLINYSLKYL